MLKICFKKARRCIVLVIWTLVIITIATTLFLNEHLRRRKSLEERDAPFDLEITSQESKTSGGGGEIREEDLWFSKEKVENALPDRFLDPGIEKVERVTARLLISRIGGDLNEGEEDIVYSKSSGNIGVAVNTHRIQSYDKKSPDEVLTDYKRNTEEMCDIESPDLVGDVIVDSKRKVSLEEAVLETGKNLINGCFVPKCEAYQKIAIVIPYKNRYEHLLMLTRHLHPILQRQNIMYCIFVAEQFDNGSFNKAQIMNAAFKEITTNHQNYGHPSEVKGKRRFFDCFIFHDVDMLLENDKNLYLCENDPKHMSPAIDKFNYTTNYGTIYGGVTAMKAETYQLVNGHSNRFWGWGGEDNDMEKRIELAGKKIVQVDEKVGRYKMIVHEHPWWFSPDTGAGSWKKKQNRNHNTIPKKKSTIKKNADNNEPTVEEYRDKSGLSDIKYRLVYSSPHLLWTKLMIDIRLHIFEQSLTHFTNYQITDVSVKTPQRLSTSRLTDKNDDEASPVKTSDSCTPSYHKFEHMTVNRTRPDTDERYKAVYKSLEAAQEVCTSMRIACQSIVEENEEFTIRSTAFVHENKLRYKLGIIEQINISEDHNTTATYVKICPYDISYMQFTLEPIIIPAGVKRDSSRRGASPRFYTNFTIRALQPTSTTFVYRTRIMTSHRATMEAKVGSKVIPGIWWDSLGKLQFSRFNLLDFSNLERLKNYRVGEDYKKKFSTGELYELQSPATSIEPYPGCYVIKHSVINEENDEPVYEWITWLQMRAETHELEDDLLAEQLQKSVRMGEEFRKIQEKNKALAKKWMHERKSLRPTNAGGEPGLNVHILHKRPPPSIMREYKPQSEEEPNSHATSVS